MEILLVHKLRKHLSGKKSLRRNVFKRQKVYLNKEKHSSQIFRHLPLPARTSGRFGTHYLPDQSLSIVLLVKFKMAAAKSATIISDKYLNQMRLECDPLADDAVLAAVRYHGERVLKCHELYSTIKELGETFQDSSCSRFLEFYEHEPPWNVDWEKCDSGRRFFVRNSAIAGLVLMYCSLVKSFTAAFGNKVSILQSIPAAPNPLPPRADPRALPFFFFALDGKFPGVGSLELSNPPG